MSKKPVLLVQVMEIVGGINFKAFPKNALALYACMLVNESFLTQKQLYILEKMGFNIQKTLNKEIL